MTIIEYFRSNHSFDLYPVQRVILKAMYGVPLSNNREDGFGVYYWDSSRIGFFTEQEYLARIHHLGLSSVGTVEPGCRWARADIVFGRRAGNTFLRECAAAYDKAYPRPLTVNPGTLRVTLPSWEVNPGLDHSFLRREHALDPTRFDLDYGFGCRLREGS